jgi:hypothetical protein
VPWEQQQVQMETNVENLKNDAKLFLFFSLIILFHLPLKSL